VNNSDKLVVKICKLRMIEMKKKNTIVEHRN